ncbi:MAG: anion transporter [Caldilineales bacterium]|nr:anion transporter [Caldilineales bacterium]
MDNIAATLTLLRPGAGLAIIVITLIGVAVGRYPGLHMDRATIALVGATALMVIGAISLEQAYAALDLDTLTLLLAMMVLNTNLMLAGFFRLAAGAMVRFARSTRQLLGIIILLSGLLSALFLNDTIVLMFTPLVLELAALLKRQPIPYLMGLVAAANIGSMAAITGNPQNMIIGVASGIPFLTFSGYLLPAALLGLGLAWAVIVAIYRQEFAGGLIQTPALPPPRLYPPLLRKSLFASGLMLIAFIGGAPIPLAALAAAALLLITRRVKPEQVFREINWSLLVFFSGLFIVTGAIETLGFSARLFALIRPIAAQGVAALTLTAVILSNLVSNVPAVLLFRPFVPALPQPEQVWLTLAMATTLAGNLTLLGSVANLIVAELARGRGVELSFREYLKAGVPITLLSLVVGVLWLLFLF